MIRSQTSSHRRHANHAAIAWVVAAAVFLGTQFVTGTADLVADAGLAVSGLLIMLGVVLTWHHWGRGIVSVVAPLLLLVAGSGHVVVGLNPELAAVMIMVVGNAGLLVAGWAQPESPLGRIRGLSRVAGAAALAACLCHLSGHDLGLGSSGMERLATLPLLGWVVVAAVALTGVRRPPPRRSGLEADSLTSATAGTRHR